MSADAQLPRGYGMGQGTHNTAALRGSSLLGITHHDFLFLTEGGQCRVIMPPGNGQRMKAAPTN